MQPDRAFIFFEKRRKDIMRWNLSADAVLILQEKPKGCDECVAQRYCEKRGIKKCPVRQVPDAVWSKTGDDYSTGWDGAVYSVAKSLQYDDNNGFLIPIKDEEICKTCSRKNNMFCPFSRGKAEFRCCGRKNFGSLCYPYVNELLDCGSDSGFEPDPDPESRDFEIGHKDGLVWVMEQMGILETKNEVEESEYG